MDASEDFDSQASPEPSEPVEVLRSSLSKVSTPASLDGNHRGLFPIRQQMPASKFASTFPFSFLPFYLG